MNYEEQVHKGWTIVVLIALAFALAVIFYLGYSSSANASEATIEAPVKAEAMVELPKAIDRPLVGCDTDLDCMLKNPNTNLIEERSKGNEY